MNKSDKQVLDAFIDGKPANSKRFDTDGTRLDGNWLGGRGIADRDADGYITFNDLGSKAAEIVQRALRKMTPKHFLKASRSVTASDDVQFVAVPLDGSPAAYFGDLDEFNAVLEKFKSAGIEEWETQVVDSPAPEIMSQLVGSYPSYDLMERILTDVVDWESEKWVLALHGMNYSGIPSTEIIDYVESAESTVFEGSAKEYAMDLVDGTENPDRERQGMYFDFVTYAADVNAAGEMPEQFSDLNNHKAGMALIEEMYGDEGIPDELYMEYFDYDGLADDLNKGGDIAEYEIDGVNYVVRMMD